MFRFPRKAHTVNNLNESPELVRREVQALMGMGLKAIMNVEFGTPVAVYHGIVLRGEAEMQAHIVRYPSDKVMQIAGGRVKVYIDANNGTSLAGSANHACGATVHCPANVTVVHDDGNRELIELVSTRFIAAGEWILYDYGIEYDDAIDCTNRKLDYIRDYVCPVCCRRGGESESSGCEE